MKGSVNLEFEDEDLRKFVQDAARRWTLNTLHDLIVHLRDPRLAMLFRELIRVGAGVGSRFAQRPSDPEPYRAPSEYTGSSPMPPPPFAGGPPPPPPSPFGGIADEILNGGDRRAGSPQPLEHCMQVPSNRYQDEGWLCCACGFVNSEHRSECRNCPHERCDDVIASEGPSKEGPS